MSRTDQATSEGTTKALTRNRVGLVLGVLLAAALYLFLPDTLATPGRLTAAVAGLMAVWWMTEAIPLPATALLPLVLFPVLGVASIDDAASPYANDIIFLFMGGFMIAIAMQRWNLHRRIALSIVSFMGTSPVMLIAGFMVATAFITMWVSNTATTVMMLPIGLSVLALMAAKPTSPGAPDDESANDGGATSAVDPNFATALMLGIAYAASIGSVATLIGTPPNALMRGYLADNHDIHIGFGQWMLIGVPLALVFLGLMWIILTKVVYPPKVTDLGGGRQLVRDELAKLGPMSRGEWIVLTVFVGAALAWIFVPLLAETLPWLDNVSDAGIAITAAVVLFLVPVDRRAGTPTLTWEAAAQLPWGILILFGGGLSLSARFSDSGLSEWIGARVGVLSAVPSWVLILVVTALVLLLTELTSNTATASVFLPIMGGVAVGMGIDVLTLVIPTALAATLAFMLPVATPPNAIVFGSGHVTIGQMLRAGTWLNICSLVVVVAAMYAIASWAFGISF